MSAIFPIRNGLKQRDTLSPFLFNFALDYAIRRVSIKQEGLKLNGTHQPLLYADNNILVGNVHTIKKRRNLGVVIKENELEVNTDTTKTC